MPAVISSQRNKINSDSKGGNARAVVGQEPCTVGRRCAQQPSPQKDVVEKDL